MNAEDILTPAELAKKLKVNVTQIYSMTRPREDHKPPLPVLRVGRYLRFCWPDVVEWLKNK